MMLREREPYSYKSDAAVPPFDDAGPIVFMDGECMLCSKTAQLISRLDRKQEVRICTVQSPLGQAILRHYGLDAADPESWLYLADGRAHVSLDGAIRLGQRLGGSARWLGVLGILPRPVQDWLYRRVARNRIWMFGRAKMCELPEPALARRIMA